MRAFETPGEPMQCEILSEAVAEEEWWDLWHRDPAATPFQSPGWLLPWRRHFPGGDSAVLAMREKGELVGLLPLFGHEGRYLPWGAGTSDWLDGLFDSRLDPAQISRPLVKLSRPVDLFQLSPGSPLLRMPMPAGWRGQVASAESCAVLSLPARLGSKMAQRLRYYRRRAARAGGEAQRREVPDIEGLAELHTRRWSARGEPGIFADPRILSWLKEALPALQRRGLLRFYSIEIRSQPAAAVCVLCAKKRAFYYIGGFDPQHEALGLGTVLVGHAIAEAEAEGCRSFDFLRGQEAYKYRWGAVDQPTHALRLTPPRWKAAA